MDLATNLAARELPVEALPAVLVTPPSSDVSPVDEVPPDADVPRQAVRPREEITRIDSMIEWFKVSAHENAPSLL